MAKLIVSFNKECKTKKEERFFLDGLKSVARMYAGTYSSSTNRPVKVEIVDDDGNLYELTGQKINKVGVRYE